MQDRIADEIIKLGRLCAEAAWKHPDDMGEAEAFVRRTLDALAPELRSRLEAQLSRMFLHGARATGALN